MKKLLVVSMAHCMAVVLIGLGFAKGITASPVYPQLGDATGDGVIDMGDATRVESMLLGLYPVKTWADADYDGVVDMGDVIRIERIIVGLDDVIHP